jgi:hypothetical protein
MRLKAKRNNSFDITNSLDSLLLVSKNMTACSIVSVPLYFLKSLASVEYLRLIRDGLANYMKEQNVM